ncbi:preprotein translocase subunit SecG [Candidatus Campbellbacteria bacterium CG11_big_fil_rev_8_21_14_0_20_44_21]|uniref:Protein-export membrane protein SecG n=1 Tax=Candidatus Campbellbacteria bacterium CG22_combo_CG10-13_8_21_14_all_43_18 TaxID=1974530 RepID=A0A2H0DWW9_9BACT|nr:MAG: preprotein translocase subunit SecG [Candidatus Campbellbacteria bacterium CG22_combo_CG10-13_8_21_14_all_43_18]PIR24491.1 MAG: preprotein translocase subunit SecG [Candidatus Campbellbacteria bacterium CG11_big_fil_rev_8_21_14_0_20_44_21]
MANILPIIQIILAVFLSAGILLQQSDAGLGSAFGGGDGGGSRTRRGAEKTLFNLTLIVAVLFVVSAFIALVI